MCQTCIGCGKCTGEVRPPIALGKCPLCGYENDPSAIICSQCGELLPMPPGNKAAVSINDVTKNI